MSKYALDHKSPWRAGMSWWEVPWLLLVALTVLAIVALTWVIFSGTLPQ